MVNQGCMCLSTYYLEYGHHAARFRRRCRRRRRHRRRAYAPTSNTAIYDNHEKINSWISFSFLYEYGAPLLLARCVDVFVEDLFMFRFVSFRFVSKQKKTSNAVGCLL